MISSVTGEPVPESLPLSHWSANLRQRVLFNTAIHRLGFDTQFQDVNLVVEIGPHSALSGPFKQICGKYGLGRFTYVPSLVRNKNGISVAGSLLLAGRAIDLKEVNRTASPENAIHKATAQNLLVDLPPYQWNHDKYYWAEPRGSIEQRARECPRHDLLGSRVSGLSTNIRVWRNVLHHRDIPWLRDHNVRSRIPQFPHAVFDKMNDSLSARLSSLREVIFLSL